MNTSWMTNHESKVSVHKTAKKYILLFKFKTTVQVLKRNKFGLMGA